MAGMSAQRVASSKLLILALAVLVAALLRFLPSGPSADASGIPVVDLRQLSGAARTGAVATLAQAAREVGIVRLINHGVDVERARKVGRAFFGLPEHLKACSNCSLRNATVGFQRGYIPFASESGLASNLEVKEGFSYGFEWPTLRTPDHPFQAANIWPPEEALAILGKRWPEEMLEFFEATVRVSKQMVEAFAEALGDRGQGLAALGEGGESISQMRMFHYLPAPPDCGTRCIGSSPHTDWHFVTLISRDDASALQYLSQRTGRWVDIPTTPGELLLLVGDWLAAYSGSAFRAPAHRVLLPAEGSSLSFVLFFYPAPNARLPRQDRHTIRDVADMNTVEATMFDLPWGDYVVQKWVKVMSNR